MANRKRTSQAPDRSTKATSTPSKEIGDALLAIHGAYVKVIQEANVRAQQKCSDAHSEYMRALSDAQLKTQRFQEDACRSYAKVMSETRTQDNPQRAAREAQDRYARELEDQQSRLRQSLEEASSKAASAVQEANAEAVKAWEDARVAYVRSLQEQFGRADPQSMDAELIAMVGQSLIAAAQYARITTR